MLTRILNLCHNIRLFAQCILIFFAFVFYKEVFLVNQAAAKNFSIGSSFLMHMISSESCQFKHKYPLNNPGFTWPLHGEVIKHYGSDLNIRFNDGMNIKHDKGRDIISISEGYVLYTSNTSKRFGNFIIIRHTNGYISSYSHCDQLTVKPNDYVRKGQTIATVGITGIVKQPQLQLTIKKGIYIMNPDN